MRTLIRVTLDAAFGLAWVGLAALMAAVAGRIMSALIGSYGFEAFLVRVGTAVMPLLLLWIPLTLGLAVWRWRAARAEEPGALLWPIAWFVHPVVVGPTAFYLGWLRPRLTGRAVPPPAQWSRPVRTIVRLLYLAATGGSLALAALVVVLLAFAASAAAVTMLILAIGILVPLSGLSTLLLMTLLIVDSVRRVAEQGDGEGVRMLSPWWGLVGIHRYYRCLLLPEMNRRALR